MKSRKDVARKIEELMSLEQHEPGNKLSELKNGRFHFGWQELKVLMDFIYGGPPKKKCDELRTSVE